MNHLLTEILSIFTIFIYTGLGAYVLSKDPHHRTNRSFAILMLIFIVWVFTASIPGISGDFLTYFMQRLMQSAFVLSLMVFAILAFSFTHDKALKKPIICLIIIPGLYLFAIIWMSDMPDFGLLGFSTTLRMNKEIILYSAIFSAAGIYMMLRNYADSRYRQREQAKLFLAGSMAAIFFVVLAGIILPMFFNIYFLPLSILAPAVMGTFFAYAVYSYGHFIIPVPEISATSFCGIECTICPEYIGKRCSGCRFDMTKYGKCMAYTCAAEKGYNGCIECPETVSCTKRTGNMDCSIPEPSYHLMPGNLYVTGDNGFGLFLDSVRHGSFGIIASITNPHIIKERTGLITTPMIWISEEGGESDVRHDDLPRLAMLITNFMKKIENAGSSMVLLDGIEKLAMVNGSRKVGLFMGAMGTAARSSGSNIIIIADQNDETIRTMLGGMENIEILRNL